MNAKKIVIGLIAVLFFLFVSACSSSDQTEGNTETDNKENEATENGGESQLSERTFTFATSNDDSGLDAEWKKKFGEAIEKNSNGKWNVEFFMGGQLGGETEILQQLKLGELDFGISGPVIGDEYFPEYNIALMPFLFPDFESIERFYAGPIGDKMKEVMKKEAGVVYLGIHSNGARWTTSNKPFSTPEEMEGLKIRLPEIPWWVDVYSEGFGAVPTPLAATEIVTALKTGVVDAQENFLSNIVGRRSWEYQEYLMPVKQVIGFQHWLVSEKTWGDLNEEEQKIIQDSIKETLTHLKTILEEMNKGFVDTAVENGMEIVEVDRKAFAEAANPVVKELIERDLAPGVYEAAMKAIEAE